MIIFNPLTGNQDDIVTVLLMLASQENCDMEPYDQIQQAAEYIMDLERQIKELQIGV